MISQALLQNVIDQANTSPKREICGVIVSSNRKNRYVPCRNIAAKDNHFVIAPDDYAAAEEGGEIIAIVHSHVYVNPEPSQADLIGIERTRLPWLIVNVPLNTYTFTYPSGYEAPYVGRQFVHEVTDCFTIWQDYARREQGIVLKDYAHDHEWWKKGQDLYAENIDDLGYVEVTDLQIGDVILMKVASPVENHAAIYYADNKILHHVMDKVSSIDVYGGYWRKITTRYLRHRSLL